MADTFPLTSTVEGARRIEKTVRAVLGSANRTGEPREGGRQPDETCWARLGSRYAGGFDWTEVRRRIGSDDKPTWDTVDGGRKGDHTASTDSEKNLAVEIVDGQAPAAGTICFLRRCPTLAKKASSSEPDQWLSRWGIVSPLTNIRFGKMTALWLPGQSQVTLQPVADAGGTPFPSPVPNPVNVSILFPAVAPAYLSGEVNAIFAYEDLGAGGLLLKNPQTTPLPTRKGEVIQNQGLSAAAPQWVADYMQAHILAP